MMRRFLVFLMAVSAAGCAHTSTLKWKDPFPGQVSSEGHTVVLNLTGENRGMFLFNLIPIWSGYATRPNRHEYKIGRNFLERADMRKLLDSHLADMGADRVEDVKITTSSSGAFSLWIVWRRTACATGVAVRVQDGKDDKKLSRH